MMVQTGSPWSPPWMVNTNSTGTASWPSPSAGIRNTVNGARSPSTLRAYCIAIVSTSWSPL